MDTCVKQATGNGGGEGGALLRDVLVVHYDSLSHRLVRRFGCPALAQEGLHDAWLRLGDISVSPAIRCADAYVYRVACNLVLDRLRAEPPGVEDEGLALELVADPAPGPEDTVLARSELDAVEEAFLTLPARHQAVLVALRIDEQTREEVAARYCLSLRTVDTTLRQALQHCAAQAGRSAPAESRTEPASRETAPAPRRVAACVA